MHNTATTPPGYRRRPSRQPARRADGPRRVRRCVAGRLGLDDEADARWGAEHVVEVTAGADADSVPDAPPVAGERLQRAPDLGLRVRADTVAARNLQITRGTERHDTGAGASTSADRR